MTRTTRMGLFALALAMAVPAPIDAQQQRRPGRDQMEAQLRARFQALIVERVGLNEAQAAAVEAIADEIMEERRQLARREFALQRELRDLTPANLDEARAGELITEILAVRSEEQRLMRTETARLREVLTDVQVLVLFQVREEFGRRIREIRGGRSGGPGGGPGGGFELPARPEGTPEGVGRLELS